MISNNRKPPKSRRPAATAVKSARAKAKKEGWLQYVRQGEGQEADERAMVAGCVVDPGRIRLVDTFFENYAVLTEGAYKGQPFKLLDWQRDYLYRMFGWVRYSEEWKQYIRRFRYCYLEVSKKNGKTPFVANIGNFLLLFDSFRRQIAIGIVASNRKQAERVIMHSIRAYKYRPDIAKYVTVKRRDNFHSVDFGDNTMEVFAAQPAGIDGFNGHILADEIHRWPNMEMWLAVRYAIASQPEGLFFGITTAGQDITGVQYFMKERSQDVLRGRVIDQEWLGAVYVASNEDDLSSEDVWRKANPSLGTEPHHPLKLETFRADYEAARKSPTDWRNFKRLRLGIQQASENNWIEPELWDAGNHARLTKQGKPRKQAVDCYQPFTEAEILTKRPYAVAALDFSSNRDTTACVITFEIADQPGTYWTMAWFWLPEARANKLQHCVPYLDWAEDPNCNLTLTPGDVTDFQRVENDLLELFERFEVGCFYFDSLWQAEYITQNLAQQGHERREFKQSISHYSPVMKTAERLIVDKKLKHNGNSLLTWQLGNVVAVSDANGEIKPVRPVFAEGKKQIDGWAALFMSLTEFQTLAQLASFYDGHEFESSGMLIDDGTN